MSLVNEGGENEDGADDAVAHLVLSNEVFAFGEGNNYGVERCVDEDECAGKCDGPTFSDDFFPFMRVPLERE